MEHIPYENQVKDVLQGLYPGRPLARLEYRSPWYKHVYKAFFEDGGSVYLKMPNESAYDVHCVEQEAAAIELMKSFGIAQPPLVVLDTSRYTLPLPYLVAEAGEGVPLGDILASGDAGRVRQAYRALGAHFARFASVKNDWAGVWDATPGRMKYPVHPAEGMYGLEIEAGSGRKAYEAGAIQPAAYAKVKALWLGHMDMLKTRPAVLTQYSAFPWSVYLTPAEGGYAVSKLTALCDLMWWDIDMTAAQLIYPPFAATRDDMRDAYEEGFGAPVNRVCAALYAMLNRLCAWAGVYDEGKTPETEAWRSVCLGDIDRFIDEAQK